MPRLPGPAVDRLGDEGNFRGPFRIVSGLAEHTNSIICDGSSELEAANGCPVLLDAGTTSREAHVRRRIPDQSKCALSQARPAILCFFLDFDLHGSRSTARNNSNTSKNYSSQAYLSGRYASVSALAITRWSTHGPHREEPLLTQRTLVLSPHSSA